MHVLKDKQSVAESPLGLFASPRLLDGAVLLAPRASQSVLLGPGGTETVQDTITLSQAQVAPSNLLAAGRYRR